MAKQNFHVCYHCSNRHIGCHATCEKYLNEQKENEEQKKRICEENNKDVVLNNLHKNRLRSNASKTVKKIIRHT